MSRTFNKVMLIGNVGNEPVLKHTPGGVPVTSFRVATSETWKDRSGNIRERTDWHTIVAWRGLAEVITKIVTKGSRIFIEGKLQSRSFEDSGGKRKHVVEILANTMLLLEKRKKRKEKDDKEQERESQNQEASNEKDDYKNYRDSDKEQWKESNDKTETEKESKPDETSESESQSDSDKSQDNDEENKNVDTFLF